MDLGSILMSLALLLVVTFVVLRPILDRTGAAEQDKLPADPLHFTREQVLVQLRDLDFDHATGTINEDEYAARLVFNRRSSPRTQNLEGTL